MSARLRQRTEHIVGPHHALGAHKRSAGRRIILNDENGVRGAYAGFLLSVLLLALVALPSPYIGKSLSKAFLLGTFQKDVTSVTSDVVW